MNSDEKVEKLGESLNYNKEFALISQGRYITQEMMDWKIEDREREEINQLTVTYLIKEALHKSERQMKVNAPNKYTNSKTRNRCDCRKKSASAHTRKKSIIVMNGKNTLIIKNQNFFWKRMEE
jgi:hypothetical protein